MKAWAYRRLPPYGVAIIAAIPVSVTESLWVAALAGAVVLGFMFYWLATHP